MSFCSVSFKEFLIIASAAFRRTCGAVSASWHISPMTSIAPARWPCSAAVFRSSSSRRASSYRLLNSELRNRAYNCVSLILQAAAAARIVGFASRAAIIFSSLVCFMVSPLPVCGFQWFSSVKIGISAMGILCHPLTQRPKAHPVHQLRHEETGPLPEAVDSAYCFVDGFTGLVHLVEGCVYSECAQFYHPFLCVVTSFWWLVTTVYLHPVRQIHDHPPILPVAPEEHGGQTVPESGRIILALPHPFRQPQLFSPLALDMHIREAGQIRYCPIVQGLCRLHLVAVALEDAGKLQLPAPAFAL